MIEHHLQRSIINQLAFSDSLRFRDLKPDGMDNKAFTYHLQKVAASGLVEKTDSGDYRLTEEGRRFGRRMADTSYSLGAKPHSTIFLIVRRAEDGAWLLYKRKTHPLKDMVGFMHGSPNSEGSVSEVATQQLEEKTGLTGSFTPLGGGFFRTFRSSKLESYTQFALLVCEDARGELKPSHEAAEYWWAAEPDFAGQDMLPNMPTLVEFYKKAQPFFVDQIFQAASEDA